MQIHDEFMIALKNGRHPFEPLITAAQSAGLSRDEQQQIANQFDTMMKDLRGPSSTRVFRGGTPDSFENYFSRKVLPKFGRNFQELFMSFGTAYGQRGSRRGTVAQGNVHIDPKSGKIIGITGRGNPLARGISSSILGSSGGGGRLPLGRATLSSSMARAAMSVFSKGRIRMNSGGMVPGYNT